MRPAFGQHGLEGPVAGVAGERRDQRLPVERNALATRVEGFGHAGAAPGSEPGEDGFDGGRGRHGAGTGKRMVGGWYAGL